MTLDNGSSIHERARAPLSERGSSAVDAQDGMFDKQWNDADLEAALEARETAREIKSSATSDFKVKNDTVKALIAKFSLASGEVARIGRFRIEMKHYAGNEIAFETAPRDQLSIVADVD